MSRATRQITSVIDATPILKKTCENKKNTRDLQKIFGDKLAEEGIKTSGLTEENSGGNRTWMTLPKIFGLCYEDKNKIIKKKVKKKKKVNKPKVKWVDKPIEKREGKRVRKKVFKDFMVQ